MPNNKDVNAFKAAAEKINREQLHSAPKTEVKSSQKTKTESDIEKFKKFVTANDLAKRFAPGGPAYLLAEAWLYIAELKHLNVSTTCVENTKEGVFCVTCAVNLIDGNDNIVSSGVMQASKKEAFLKDKADFAVYGMAQTRAISRAVRNKYGYIARACGFQSTPIDEMPPDYKQI